MTAYKAAALMTTDIDCKVTDQYKSVTEAAAAAAAADPLAKATHSSKGTRWVRQLALSSAMPYHLKNVFGASCDGSRCYQRTHSFRYRLMWNMSRWKVSKRKIIASRTAAETYVPSG